MSRKRKKLTARSLGVEEALRIEQFQGLAGELQTIRQYPPLVRKSKGKYEGNILGFVKGLKLSARMIYILRDELSSRTDLAVSWGHLIDDRGKSCSRECDIIIHKKGFVRKWNGNENPIMDFVFVHASQAQAVISCKSTLNSIDRQYTSDLRKFGIRNVFLFAESCSQSRLLSLRRSAKRAGYRGVWCLYLTKGKLPFLPVDGKMHLSFIRAVQKTITNAPRVRQSAASKTPLA